MRRAHQEVVRSNNVNLWFSRFANRTATLVGHPYMFLAAVVTFLVVFLIQNTQNVTPKPSISNWMS